MEDEDVEQGRRGWDGFRMKKGGCEGDWRMQVGGKIGKKWRMGLEEMDCMGTE